MIDVLKKLQKWFTQPPDSWFQLVSNIQAKLATPLLDSDLLRQKITYSEKILFIIIQIVGHFSANVSMFFF